MMPRDDKQASKFLSLVLRHQPEKIGIELDEQGYVFVEDLIKALQKNGWTSFSRKDLDRVVETNNKKRFAYGIEGLCIRASQGHSVEVDLALEPQEPPEFLFHGTVEKFIKDIKQNGLQKQSRHDVHLSVDRATAINVGSRRGSPVTLVIKALQMYTEGHLFYKSANGVWLTNEIPALFIEFPE